MCDGFCSLTCASLSISKSGSGTITSSGIDCGATCSASYAVGTSVLLTATPATGYLFDSWSGCSSPSGNNCTATMNESKSISASFIPKTLNVSLSVSPDSGYRTLSSILTANVSGTAVGTINYTFYCDRNDNGTNITSPNNGKYDGESATTKSHTCTYSALGTFYPKVIVERDNSVPNATDKKTATVLNQAPSASSLSVSAIPESNYCKIPFHTFSWGYSDPDGDAQSKFQLQVDNNSDFSSPEVNRTVPGISNIQQVFVALSATDDKLTYNETTYYWRVRVWDSNGLVSDYTSGSNFATAKHVFPTVQFKASPTNPSTNELVQFTDLTTGGAPINGWIWSISDAVYQGGTTANSQNPKVKFTSTGTKIITLTAKDADDYQCSNTDTASSLQNIKIKLPLPGWKEAAP